MSQASGHGKRRRVVRAQPRRAAAGNKRPGAEPVTGPFPGGLCWADDSSIWAANLDGTNPQDLIPEPHTTFEPTIGLAAISTGSTPTPTRSAGPTWMAATPRTSSPATSRSPTVGWRSTPATSTGPISNDFWHHPAGQPGRQQPPSDRHPARPSPSGSRSTPVTSTGPTTATGPSGGPTLVGGDASPSSQARARQPLRGDG